MSKENLSERLKKVSEYIPAGSTAADIGTDHAYLPVYLVQEGIVTRAVAGDVREGPLASARSHINKHGLAHKIKAKLGNGLDVLEEEEIDTVVIAGMGGPLIARILEEGRERLSTVSRLVLQPNVAADRIREWLLANDWALTDEKILEEDSHVYEILTAEKGDSSRLYREDKEKKLWLGPFLLTKKNQAFKNKWQRELIQLENILRQLNFAKTEEDTSARRKEIEKKITWLKEELE